MASTVHFFCINEKENYRISGFLSEVHLQKMHSGHWLYSKFNMIFIWSWRALREVWMFQRNPKQIVFSFKILRAAECRCIFWWFKLQSGPAHDLNNQLSWESFSWFVLEIKLFRIYPGLRTLRTGLPFHLMILPSETTIFLIWPDITVIQMAHGTMMLNAKEYWPGHDRKEEKQNIIPGIW